MTVISAHLDDLRRRGLRPTTIYQRRRALVRLAQFLDPTPLTDAERAEIESWIFDARRLSPEAQAAEISHLHGFYLWALDVGLVEIDPMARTRRPRIPHRLPRPMADEDLELAIASAPVRIKPWLLLAAYAGLRCAEIAQVRAEDVLWRESVLVITESKGGSNTSVPLSPWLVDQLRLCDLPTRGWLFRRADGRPGPNKPWIISSLGNRYLRSVGVNATMHQARHWFGTHTLRASGGNVRTAQEALRHVSIASTQRYTYVAPAEVAAAVALLPHPA